MPTEIHEALGLVGSVPESVVAAAAEYEAGLDAYFIRDFIRAAERFDEALCLRPDDTAAAILRERAVASAASPPPASAATTCWAPRHFFCNQSTISIDNGVWG